MERGYHLSHWGRGNAPSRRIFFSFLGREMHILVYPWALLSSKCLLCCNMLIVLFSKRKYFFSDKHATDEKFSEQKLVIFLYLSSWAYLSWASGCNPVPHGYIA